MLVVIDTNILVSGLLSPFGPPARVLDQVISGNLQVAFDDRIIDEYIEVFRRPLFAFDPAHVDALIDHIKLTGRQTSADPLNPQSLPDPSDLPFAEVALSSGAKAFVTGNSQHFEVLKDHGIPVTSPRDFLDMLGRVLSE